MYNFHLFASAKVVLFLHICKKKKRKSARLSAFPFFSQLLGYYFVAPKSSIAKYAGVVKPRSFFLDPDRLNLIASTLPNERRST